MFTSPDLTLGGYAAAVALTIAVAFTPADAAVIVQIQGDILADTGQGFRPIADGTELKPGDRIMARTEGSAVVSYANGCLQTVKPGAVVSAVTDEGCEQLKLEEASNPQSQWTSTVKTSATGVEDVIVAGAGNSAAGGTTAGGSVAATATSASGLTTAAGVGGTAAAAGGAYYLVKKILPHSP